LDGELGLQNERMSTDSQGQYQQVMEQCLQQVHAVSACLTHGMHTVHGSFMLLGQPCESACVAILLLFQNGHSRHTRDCCLDAQVCVQQRLCATTEPWAIDRKLKTCGFLVLALHRVHPAHMASLCTLLLSAFSRQLLPSSANVQVLLLTVACS
jgi:hypothetical protein